MKSPDIIEQTRKLLADGETEAAINFLRPFLEAEKSSSQLARALLVTESNLKTARQKGRQSLLTVDEIRKEEARATDSILQILEHLDGDKMPRTQAQKMQRGLWFLIGLAGAAAAAIFLILPFFKLDCPNFRDPTALKIIILPFTNVGSSVQKPEQILQNDIENLTQKAGIKADAEINTNYGSAETTPDFTKAKNQAQHCGGDLVIWGQYLVAGDSTRLRFFFQFAKGETGKMTGFEAMPDPTFWQKGELKSALSDALFSVCAAIAVREQKLDVAERWLNKVAQKTSFETEGLAQLAARKAVAPVVQ